MNLNTNMVVVVAPMGRDLAAFAEPSHAWDYAVALGHKVSFRKPNGTCRALSGFATLSTFDTWCRTGGAS